MSIEIFQPIQTLEPEWPAPLAAYDDDMGAILPDNARGFMALAALGGLTYGGWKMSEGRPGTQRLLSTAGGAALGLIVALFIDPPFG